jgi:hypothetical protein
MSNYRPVWVAFLLGSVLAGTPALAAKPMKKNPYKANKAFTAIIKKNHREFDRCGQAEVARTKRKLKGIVLVRYVVNGDGKVAESGTVHNTTKSKAIAECVLRTFDQLKFPATFGPPVTGSYSFKFDLKK